MALLTAPRVVLVRQNRMKKFTFPLKAGATAWEAGMACLDTASPGTVVPGNAGSTTLKPIGWFMGSVNNSAGGAAVPVPVELFRERDIAWWDSVAGGGAITIANLLQTLYVASDHELTTVQAGNSPFGFMWAMSPQGYPGAIGVEASF